MDARRNTRSGTHGGNSLVNREIFVPPSGAPELVAGEDTHHPGLEPDVNYGVADNVDAQAEIPLAPASNNVAQMAAAMAAGFFRE